MNAIYKFVLGLIGKRSGVVTTLPNQKQIEFQANMLAEKFMQNGIDPNALKSPEQVKNVLANIDQANMKVIPGDSAEGKGITEKLLGKKKAPVFDMEGNKIPEGSKIMGGKEVKPFDELKNYTKSEEEIIQDLVDQKFGKGYFDDVDGSKAAIKDAAIKARLDADNKKGIAGIKINLVDDSIAKIKSMEPMEAMKEANLVAGKKGKYANLDDNQVKKIIDDTNDHIFERDIPDEDFATGGRVGLKGGAFLNFIKNMTMNKKSPLQFGKDYLKNVKEKTLRANETGKFMDLPLAEVGLPATTGALVNNQIRKKLKAMNEEQKEENLKNFIMKLENDEFYQKYPELKDETIAKYTEKLFGEKKADGGRIGYFKGAVAGGENISPGTDVGGNVRNDNPFTGGGDGPSGPPTVINPPPKDNKIIEKIKAANTSKLSPFQKFLAHDRFTDMMKASKTPNYHQMGGLDFMARFPDINPDVAKGLASAYQTIFEGARAIADGPGGVTFEDAGKKAAEESRLNAVGIDAFSDPNSETYKQYTSDTFGLKPAAVQMADGGRIGYKAGSVDKMRRLILKTIGAGTAGIAGAKSGIFSFGKGAGKTVAKEVAQQTTSSMPPPYFFKLAEKIKMMGDDATATTDRTIAKTLKSKDGKSTYLLEEDVSTGDTVIKKINKEGDEMITDVEIMELKKGEVVQGKDGKAIKTPDEYEEVTEANARIEGDTFNDPYYSDGIQVDEIIKEVDDKVPSIKYASGGLAYMLGE